MDVLWATTLTVHNFATLILFTSLLRPFQLHVQAYEYLF
jgi:hypothetical protein